MNLWQSRAKKDCKGSKFAYSKEGQEDEERHNRPYPRRIWNLKEEKRLKYNLNQLLIFL